eukprot:TRINITY_DN19927_c0_g1_i1.p1 TRINITY_DN19927_c0_g1~~TRINITY_DN19927_c0_g1_i1.p1  ORF type:complete len:570 (+),score=154.29 TRINITY_DN19927_c0_g1_i1:126-1835(+)
MAAAAGLRDGQQEGGRRDARSQLEWITLNVGGKIFRTFRQTLLMDEHSILYSMLGPDSHWEPMTDDTGAIIIDADPAYFQVILNYLRMNEVVIDPGVSPKGVIATAKYLQVQGVVDWFDRERRQVMFAWGSGSSGELGTQDRCDALTPVQVDVVPFGQRVVEVALGANYSCVLTDKGQVYVFGNGDWGQLGVGNTRGGAAITPSADKQDEKTSMVTVPMALQRLAGHRIVSIATGYAYAMALTDNHQVFFWGNNNHGQSGLGPQRFGTSHRKIEEPTVIDLLEGKQIIQVGCGSFFVIALGHDGTVWSWGLIDCLGLGQVEDVKGRWPDEVADSVSKDKRAVLLTPRPIEALAEKRTVRIAAGQWHSCAITEQGELYSWGVGFQGRLGHGDKEPCFIPTRVRGQLESQHVVDVSCGSFHTVALTQDGRVYCWGDNANGQCGSSALPDSVTLPHLATALSLVGGGVARSISCGRQHTAVVMTGPHNSQIKGARFIYDHGQVYVFGESKGMGLGNSSKVHTPKLVRGMEEVNVHRVFSGLHHTIVMAEAIPPETCEQVRPFSHRIDRDGWS